MSSLRNTSRALKPGPGQNDELQRAIAERDRRQLQRELDAQALEHAKAERARRDGERLELDLHAFVRYAWQVLEPHTPFIDSWHIGLICRYLERVTAGELSRLVINIPPGSSKSRIVTVMWPVWEWIRRPWLRSLFYSYSQVLSTQHSMERRTLVESEWFQARWGERVALRRDHNLKSEIATTAVPGMMTATSVGGTSTGKGGERLVIDDPLNPKQAASIAELANAALFWQQTLPTRLRNHEIGAIVLVMQRLAQGDPTDLALEEGYTHLCLPMEYEPDHPYVCPDDPRTEPGELLCPARFNRKTVDLLKAALGSFATAGQLQQRPAPKGGAIWREEHFNDAATLARPGRRHVFNVVDFAYSSKQTADYTVVMTFAGNTATGELEVTNVTRMRADVLATAEAGQHRWLLRDSRERAGAEYTLVEKAGLASRVIELAQRDGEPVRGIDADRDKVARAYAAVPLAEMGKLYADKGAPWWPDLWLELGLFPNGAHDDQADCLAYGCIHWRDIMTGHQAHGVAQAAMNDLFP